MKIEILEFQETPGIYLLLLAPPDGCPITYRNAKPITENVADGCISGSSATTLLPRLFWATHPPLYVVSNLLKQK